MRLIAFLFLFFVSNGCSNKVDTSFIPKEFDYSDDKIGSGKTFVYKNALTGQESFKDIKIIHQKDKSYRTVKSYDSHSVSDSAIISNGQTIELHNFFMSADDKIIKGEKLQDTIISGNEKLGTHFTKWIYQTPQLLYTTSSEEKFIKDTSISWQGHQLACLVTQARGNVSLQQINDASANHQTVIISRLYFAEGIGLIKYSIEFTDRNGKYNNNSWDLITIKEAQQ